MASLHSDRGRFYFLFLHISHSARLSILKNRTVPISFYSIHSQRPYSVKIIVITDLEMLALLTYFLMF
jgi:hypothetical protein